VAPTFRLPDASLKTVGKNPFPAYSEPITVILSEAKDLALGAQGKLREESRPGWLARHYEIPCCLRLLEMTGE
jgi:hypothetical protein